MQGATRCGMDKHRDGDAGINERRRFEPWNDLMTVGDPFAEGAMKSIEDLIYTLEVIRDAVWEKDKDKGFEAVTVFLMQFMPVISIAFCARILGRRRYCSR